MLEFVTGAEVIARAAIDAGCNFFAGYPITPATGILLSLVRLMPKARGIFIQGEDEIASIGFCIGASSAGMKPMTATSGPGISLYSENIGFAQMAELPIVIINVQRMGPATGGATTNAEGDIQFIRWVTSGGYPMIVLSPTTLEEAYELTIESFNLAERFRTPVVLSTCKDLVMNRSTADISKYKKPKLIERTAAANMAGYLPYNYNNLDDVPLFAPIGGDILTRINTSTHNKAGMLTKDPDLAGPALLHLNEKIMKHADEIERVDGDIQDGAETIIVAYGSMGRTSREVINDVRKGGGKISLAVVKSIWPLPEKSLIKIVGSHKKIIVPELNLGQYVLEIERLFPDKKVIPINRVDGKLISPEQIINEIH
jgi:2-oxoglutarate ferredoxin oxidoreductase subunit alpha